MRIVDIIVKKRDGGELSAGEIASLVRGYVAGEVPDYQVAAWLMAVFFRGMGPQEVSALTREMMRSGRVLSFPGLRCVDKHSTGGVGDKISLPLAPAVAACGVPVPMMSGRALGHTGGTLDKMESIPGYRTVLSPEEVERLLGECGYAMFGQTEQMVPADRKLYALRDVTGTVESIPLITASILSKKCAEGAQGLVFDVKTGSGAFMKREEDARSLARSLVEGARELGREAVALVTDMSQPLGRMVGNFLEVEEAVEVLRGGGPADVRELVCVLGGEMLVLGGKAASLEEGRRMIGEVLDDGRAYERWVKNVGAQGGDVEELERRLGKWRAPVVREVRAVEEGVVGAVDAYRVGLAGVVLGVGRSRVEDAVLPDVGVECVRKRGERVARGEVLARVYARDETRAEEAARMVGEAYRVGEETPSGSLVLERISP